MLYGDHGRADIAAWEVPAGGRTDKGPCCQSYLPIFLFETYSCFMYTALFFDPNHILGHIETSRVAFPIKKIPGILCPCLGKNVRLKI